MHLCISQNPQISPELGLRLFVVVFGWIPTIFNFAVMMVRNTPALCPVCDNLCQMLQVFFHRFLAANRIVVESAVDTESGGPPPPPQQMRQYFLFGRPRHTLLAIKTAIVFQVCWCLPLQSSLFDALVTGILCDGVDDWGHLLHLVVLLRCHQGSRRFSCPPSRLRIFVRPFAFIFAFGRAKVALQQWLNNCFWILILPICPQFCDSAADAVHVDHSAPLWRSCGHFDCRHPLFSLARARARTSVDQLVMECLGLVQCLCPENGSLPPTFLFFFLSELSVLRLFLVQGHPQLRWAESGRRNLGYFTSSDCSALYLFSPPFFQGERRTSTSGEKFSRHDSISFAELDQSVSLTASTRFSTTETTSVPPHSNHAVPAALPDTHSLQRSAHTSKPGVAAARNSAAVHRAISQPSISVAESSISRTSSLKKPTVLNATAAGPPAKNITGIGRTLSNETEFEKAGNDAGLVSWRKGDKKRFSLTLDDDVLGNDLLPPLRTNSPSNLPPELHFFPSINSSSNAKPSPSSPKSSPSSPNLLSQGDLSPASLASHGSPRSFPYPLQQPQSARKQTAAPGSPSSADVLVDSTPRRTGRKPVPASSPRTTVAPTTVLPPIIIPNPDLENIRQIDSDSATATIASRQRHLLSPVREGSEHSFTATPAFNGVHLQNFFPHRPSVSQRPKNVFENS